MRVERPPHYDTFAEFHYSYHYGDSYIPHIQQEEPLKVVCHHFVDCIEKGAQPAYTKGLGELATQTRQLYPQAASFSSLNSEQQIKVLTAMEKTPFFNTVRTHTISGFFASPVHGGNYDKAGWKLVQYDDSLNHKPPFGYYDGPGRNEP